MIPSMVRRALRVTRSRMFALALITLALGAAPALAVGPGGGPSGGGGGSPNPQQGGGGTGGGGGGGGGNVPEINPNAAVAALTLLGGMTLILTDRLRRRQLAQT
jgi:hypothetical protein